MSFGKIFESTFTGSMAGSGPSVFAVWAYVIANTRPPGAVEINPLILAAILGTTPGEINAAIEVLTSPDERSRTKLHDGRRLLKTGDFSYDVPTWQQYRDARNDEERKAYNREAQRKHRLSNSLSMTVSDSKPKQKQKQSTEAEAEAVPPSTGAKGISEGRSSDRLPTTPQSQRIAALFHRRLTTAWSESEVKAYRELGVIAEDDLTAVERYYAAERAKGDEGRHRRDLGTFLNNFSGELDRAKARCTSFKRSPDQDPEGWSEFLKDKDQTYKPFRFSMDYLKTEFIRLQKTKQ